MTRRRHRCYLLLLGPGRSGRKRHACQCPQRRRQRLASLSIATVASSDGAYTDKVSVNWGVVSGAGYYQVSRATTAGGAKTVLSGWISATSYDDATATPGVAYYYSAQAAADAGGSRASAYSAEDGGWRPFRPQR